MSPMVSGPNPGLCDPRTIEVSQPSDAVAALGIQLAATAQTP